MLGQSDVDTSVNTVYLIWGAIILWVVPIFVAYAIGKSKRRPGSLYGFLQNGHSR